MEDLTPWIEALERRHLSDLTFPEVRHALQALSSLYVERRSRLGRGDALDSAGKRAAFCLFYGPLHFLVTRAIVRRLGAGAVPPRQVLDLGCGSGAAGAAWALECERRPVLRGVDRQRWAVEEARWTWRTLGLAGSVRQGHLERTRLDGSVLLTYTVNELDPTTRDGLLESLVRHAADGGSLLIVEPISRRVSPWWAAWSERLRGVGARIDDWRFPSELPEIVHRLDRAAGLDHRELTARSLFVGSS